MLSVTFKYSFGPLRTLSILYGYQQKQSATTMFFKLFLAFTLIPVIELYLLIKVGSIIGALNTILLVILTGAAGAYLAQLQGMQTMFRVRERMQRGEMPAAELLDAFIIFAAGVVLLTPGLLTDICGLLLLFPTTRAYFKKWLKLRMEKWLQNPNVHIQRYR